MVSDQVDGTDVGRLNPSERRWAWIGALIAVLGFLMLATWGQPWNMFEKGPNTSDFYDQQARAIAHGHLDVPAEVAGIEGFRVGDRTQLYFGVAPALMRLPLTGWSDAFDRRLVVLSMTIAVLVLGLAAARLLKRSRVLVDRAPPGSPWWYAVMAGAVVLCTPVLALASRTVVYNEAEIWGAAAALAGLDLVLRWWRVPSRRHFIDAVAIATFAMACRPSSGMAPAFAIGVFGLVLAWRRQWGRAVITIGGAVFALLGFVLVNWLRFRSLTSQPFPDQALSKTDPIRQAFLESNGGSYFGLKFAPTTVLHYLSPFSIGFQRLFPFVTFGDRATIIGDVLFDDTYQSSSLTLGAPVFFVLALIGTWWTALRDRTRQWSVLAIAALVSTIGTFTIGFIGHRYLADLVPALIVLACPGIWLVARRAPSWSTALRRSLIIVTVFVSLLATWTQIGLSLELRAFSMLPAQEDTRSLVALQNAIDRRLFDSPPPLLEQRTSERLPTEDVRDGALVILDDCGGLYRYDGFNWQVVERRPGGGRRFLLTGSIGEKPTVVLQGFGWSLSARRSPDGVVFMYDTKNGRHDESAPAELPEGPVTLDVIADPAQVTLISVSHDGERLFSQRYVPAAKASPGRGWTQTPGSAPLCESLLGRLGG